MILGNVNFLICLPFFGLFLDNYPAKFDITLIRHSRKKLWPSKRVFLTLLENYRANFQVKCSLEIPDFGESSLLYRPRPAFSRKNCRCRKAQFLNFDRFVEIFLKNSPIKSEMKISIERSGCANCFCRSGYSLIFC